MCDASDSCSRLLSEAIRAVLGIELEGARFDSETCVDALVENKLVLPAYSFLSSDAVKQLGPRFAGKVEEQRKRNVACAEAISCVCDCAARAGLPVAVIKGRAFESCVYGMEFARDSGDVDLLVAPEDAVRLHNLLGELGYVQQFGPGSSGTGTGSRGRALAALRASSGASRKAEYAVPLKRHPDKHEYIPYVKTGSPAVEVHDGFFGIPSGYSDEVLGRAFRSGSGLVKDPVDNLVLLLANTYENSESFFSNCFDRGIVLRDYLDLRVFFANYCHALDWKAVEELVVELGMEEIAGHVLRNLEDIFGSEADCGCMDVVARRPSRWGVDVLSRIREPELARTSSLGAFRTTLANRSRLSSVAIEAVRPRSTTLSDDVASFGLRCDDGGSVCLMLAVKKEFLSEGCILQMAVYPLEREAPALAYKIDVSVFEGTVRAFSRCANRLLVNAAVKKKGGEEIAVCVEDDGGKTAFLEMRLPDKVSQVVRSGDCAVGFGVFRWKYSDVYWRVDAGDVPLFDDVSVGKVYRPRQDVSAIRLRFSYGECRIVVGDDELARQFVQTFPNAASGIGLRVAPLPSQEFEIRRRAHGGGYSVLADGFQVASGVTREGAADRVMQRIGDMFCALATGDVLVAHASAVRMDFGVVVFMGVSGSGKSSLAVAFSQYGTIMGDECVFIDSARCRAWCEDFPVQIKAGNSRILDRVGDGPALVVSVMGKGRALYLPKELFNADENPLDAGVVKLVVFPTFREGVGTAVLKRVESSALVGLVLNSLMGAKPQSAVFASFAHMASEHSLSLVEMEYSDAYEAAAALNEFVANME